jgi:hypothetical protein
MFIVVVVLPTPPFWFETDITLPIFFFQKFKFVLYHAYLKMNATIFV